MAVIPIWPGSSSFSSGSTPFGFYDNDLDFQIDSDKVANFCARRLGYPIVDVELQDLNFYTAFEESITTYGNELYAYQVRENFLSLEGASNTVDVKNTLLTPTLNRIIDFSQQYGVEAGVGGNIDWYDGLVGLSASVQDYDLNAWAVEQGYDSGDIEIKRVFYEAPPAIVRYFDPYAGTGTDLQGLLSTFGFGSYSPGINFLMMPLSFDIQKLQAIEFNDQVRKSNYSFEIRNNKLKIFPIPKATGGKLKIQYILKSERAAAAFQDGTNKITDVSNVPYTNPVYSKINSIGRSWMFEYTLAIVKEMLGYVRGKYGSVPIPGDTVTLNQSDLISAATLEKSNLIERLRTYFDETSREKLLESRTKETEFRKQELNEVPFTIYIS
tara:strand:- start:2388 stop:3536 length:1149 start_codon:yes stop_codon:yes gene_type:complete